jgi:hypothetical protein
MNKQITELALKAKLGSAEFDNGIRYYVSTEKSFERFAKLIVEECAKVASVETSDNGVGEVIREHFGVEE